MSAFGRQVREHVFGHSGEEQGVAVRNKQLVKVRHKQHQVIAEARGQHIEQPGHQRVERVVHFTCVASVRLTGHVAQLLAVKHIQVTCQRTEEGVNLGVVG